MTDKQNVHRIDFERISAHRTMLALSTIGRAYISMLAARLLDISIPD
ncbi:MAG TPA: hypothetical protein VFC02_10025 [Anaerolineales bacterium]|nr:hypothetical protein [Anaerolineales bacterium]